MKTSYIVAGLFALWLVGRSRGADAAGRQVMESIPVNGSDVEGNVWEVLSGFGRCCASQGVNARQA